MDGATFEYDELTEEQKAEARGDVFSTEKEAAGVVLDGDLDPEILALVAKEEDEDSGKTATDDESGADEKKDGFIPKGRFNEVNNELKELKAKLEALEKGKSPDGEHADDDAGNLPPDPRAELKTLRQLQKDALLEGDQEEYDRLTDEIDVKQIEIAKTELRTEQQQEMTQAELKRELGKAAREAFDIYPFLDNANPETCDPDAVSAVRTRRFQLEAEGLNPIEALRKAVEEKGPKFAKANGYEVDTSKADKIREERAQAAREKAAAASLAQPVELKGKGEQEKLKIDVSKMSDAEYGKLPENVKARLRGDIL